ncbi:MAG: hypothetical protein H0V79_02050 [Actinobacteria bacterium]|nr:hypothetical protein [Actinomycetota bacterium]
MLKIVTSACLASVALLAAAATAGAASVPTNRNSADRAPYVTKGGPSRGSDTSAFSADAKHDGSSGHLPGSSLNVELLGKLEPKSPFGPLVPGQIADVAVFKDFAYLNSWDEPTCSKGGIYIADLSDPRKPAQAGFIPALPKNYHGEGAHGISMATRAFTGDVIAVNNETCADTERGGGFDLYDVSDPRNPQVLVQAAGDFGGEGQMNGPGTKAKEYHSVYMWKNAGKVYLVASDNEELHDVDIFDISDPRRPKPVAEYDLLETFPQIAETPAPYGDLVLNHDMVVKEIGGRQILLESYWDAGYVMVDITNPAKPTYVGDTDFGPSDPLVPGIRPPEGNAHQAEFSFDNAYFLAADEDFNPYRADTFSVGEAERPAAEVGGGSSVASLPDQTLSGPVVYGGYGCPADPATMPKASDYTAEQLGLQAGDEKILLMQRGPSGDPSADYNANGNLTDDACFPGEKAAEAFDAGWDAIVLVNRHTGSDDTAGTPFCGSGGYLADKPMVTTCTTHAAYHEVFETTPQFTTPYSSTDAPVLGTISPKRVTATSKFDGWGYAHLYRREGGKAARVGSYAIPEALDPAYAFGFGDLSIHEFATDPAQNLAYSAYYSGGVRVFRFGATGLTEVGHYIDPAGSNVWGIEQFAAGAGAPRGLRGKRLIAASDRDGGLQILRYTGG